MMEQNAKRAKGDKPRNLTRKQKEPRLEQNAKRLLTTRRNQEMMMEQNARRVGRPAAEPYPQAEGTKIWWWKGSPEEYP